MKGLITAFVFALVGSAVPGANGETLSYTFSQDEPLDYRLTIQNQIGSELTRAAGSKSAHDRHSQSVDVTVDCRLVPIAKQLDGTIKLRFVVDRLEQRLTEQGELTVTTLTRKGLRRECNGKVTEAEFFDLGDASGKSGSIQDLLDEPILMVLERDGTLREFDDRSLLGRVFPAIDFRKCLELILVRVPADAGARWSERRAMDSPRDEKLPDSFVLPVNYTREGATVRFDGTASFTGQQIPIGTFEEKWLRWTTYLESIADSERGVAEFADGAPKRVEFSSQYRCRLRNARKEDGGRRQTTEEFSSDLRVTLIRKSPALQAWATGDQDATERR